jgi:NAD(P)-dependent dehydrogenase (short-subunit alcohol dehydrogenase family)
MTQKTVLITGANKGIGLEIARQLLNKGCSVIVSGRDSEKLAKAKVELKKENHELDMLIMDVSDPDSIANAANNLSSKNIKLDVLINNAAIMDSLDKDLSEQDLALLEKTVRTNAYGPLQIIKSFLPLMNNPSRIINISSGGGSMTDPVGGWSPAYCVSKSLLNAITRHIAYELPRRNISVNAVCPGWVKTEMGGPSAPRSVQKGAETPVWLALEAPQEFSGLFFRDKKVIDW